MYVCVCVEWDLSQVDLVARHVGSMLGGEEEPAKEISYETVRHICSKLVYDTFQYRLHIPYIHIV